MEIGQKICLFVFSKKGEEKKKNKRSKPLSYLTILQRLCMLKLCSPYESTLQSDFTKAIHYIYLYISYLYLGIFSCTKNRC